MAEVSAPGVSVRVATEVDMDALFDIRTSVRENHLTLEELAEKGVTPGSVAEAMRTTSRVWVAEVDGVPQAFSMADAEKGTVFAMFVRPGHEGRGVGRALMRETEVWLFGQGWEEIWLLTGGEPEIRAHGFYRRLGWRAARVEEDGQVRYVKRSDATP